MALRHMGLWLVALLCVAFLRVDPVGPRPEYMSSAHSAGAVMVAATRPVAAKPVAPERKAQLPVPGLPAEQSAAAQGQHGDAPPLPLQGASLAARPGKAAWPRAPPQIFLAIVT